MSTIKSQTSVHMNGNFFEFNLIAWALKLPQYWRLSPDEFTSHTYFQFVFENNSAVSAVGRSERMPQLMLLWKPLAENANKNIRL